MLEYFNEETENGRLFISYPMAEALKDLNNNEIYAEKFVSAKITGDYYKKEVSNRSIFKDIRKIDKHDWSFIIKENCKKANLIVNQQYTIPQRLIEQNEIFSGQLEHFIEPCNKIAVLSGFPLFLVEYYGNNFYTSL